MPLTAFLQKPPKRRRSSIRASLGTPVTVPLSVNLPAFIIDEIFMAIVLPSSLLGSYNINSISRTLRKLQIFPACYSFAQCPVLAASSVGLKLMQRWVVTARGYWAELTACVSMLSISSHQAISRALSLNISSDQIDWKGVIRFELRSMSLWVSVQHPPVITWAKHHATNKAVSFNMDSGDINILTCARSKTGLIWLLKGSPARPPNRFSGAKKLLVWHSGGLWLE